jgi:cholesterol transport system auxiliary component
MRRNSRLVGAVAASLAAAFLAGCISLFPKQPPAQIYQFGQAEPAAPGPGATAMPAFTVSLAAIDFNPAAAGERLLTANGVETAYIAGARWVSPASALFDEAVVRAFETGPARLLAIGEPTRADYSLTLDVRTFEARYAGGADAAPTVRVVVYAAMGRLSERDDHGRLFIGEAAAADNRVGAIVGAYDAALAKVFAQLVPWVEAKGEG